MTRPGIRRARAAALLALGLVAGMCGTGCRESVEMVRRWDAERDRWRADQQESGWIREHGRLGASHRERLRESHRRIATRYGSANSPSEAELRDRDVALRLRIAGSSALYAADLAANGPATPELLVEYSEVARVYAFDRNLSIRAGLGAGWTAERLESPREALSIYVELLRDQAATEAARGPGARFGMVQALLVDLEVHASILAGSALEPGGANDVRLGGARRLEAWGEGGESRPGERRIDRRRAELHFLAGEWDEGIALLVPRFEEAGTVDERAEIALVLGEAAEFGARDAERAEAWYREAARQGEDVPSAAEGRMRLGDLLTRTGRAWEGMRELETLLGLGARVLEDRRAEILVLKARSLVALDRWEDALPSLRDATLLDPGDPFVLVAAAEIHARLRRFTRPAAGPAAREFVSLAETVPGRAGPAYPSREWAEWAREVRRRAAWRAAVEELRTVARSAADEELARAAAEAADRIGRERG